MIDQLPSAAPAAQRRRSRLSRPASRSADDTAAGLRDGSRVLIRPVCACDAALLADGFARLSPRSRHQRFLAPKTRLTAAELRYLTDIDHYDHEALGALDLAGRGVGIARYIRSRTDPRAAELAVTVVDAWQGRGLGLELTRRLSDRARHAGISTFTALVTADNAAVAGLLRRLGGRLTGRDHECLEYEIPLLPGDDHDYGFGALIALWRI